MSVTNTRNRMLIWINDNAKDNDDLETREKIAKRMATLLDNQPRYWKGRLMVGLYECSRYLISQENRI